MITFPSLKFFIVFKQGSQIFFFPILTVPRAHVHARHCVIVANLQNYLNSNEFPQVSSIVKQNKLYIKRNLKTYSLCTYLSLQTFCFKLSRILLFKINFSNTKSSAQKVEERHSSEESSGFKL